MSWTIAVGSARLAGFERSLLSPNADARADSRLTPTGFALVMLARKVSSLRAILLFPIRLFAPEGHPVIAFDHECRVVPSLDPPAISRPP